MDTESVFGETWRILIVAISAELKLELQIISIPSVILSFAEIEIFSSKELAASSKFSSSSWIKSTTYQSSIMKTSSISTFALRLLKKN